MNANRLVLGSANFGLQYGVKNQRKLPESEVEKILTTCRSTGIATIDTAIGYGDSQKVLGARGCNDFHLVTKLSGLPAEVKDVSEWVWNEITQCLHDLRVEKLYGLLLHRPGDLLGPYGPELARALLLAQEEFNIQKLGVSVYEPHELLDCWKVLQYDLAQLPCNVFDQRFTFGPIVAYLRSRNIEVHARSVFLQGLLLMPDLSLPGYFNPWADVFEAWRILIDTSNKTPLEVCLAFAKQQSFIHKWVIGVDSKDQLMGILSASELCDNVIPETAWVPFKDLPLELISPARWSLQ